MTFAMEQVPDLEPSAEVLKFQSTPTYGYHGRPVNLEDANEPDAVYGYDVNFNILLTTITKIKKIVSVSHNPETFLFPHRGCFGTCGRWYAERNGSGDRWYPKLKDALRARAIDMLDNGFELIKVVDKSTHVAFRKLKALVDGFDKPSKFPGEYFGYDIANVILESGKLEADSIVVVLGLKEAHAFTSFFKSHFKIYHKGFGEVNSFVRVIIKPLSEDPV